jgi:hypothetical protein
MPAANRYWHYSCYLLKKVGSMCSSHVFRSVSLKQIISVIVSALPLHPIPVLKLSDGTLCTCYLLCESQYRGLSLSLVSWDQKFTN